MADDENKSSVSPDRFDDLKDTMTTRFDSLQHSLDLLESKDHHSAEITHVNWRVTDLESKVEEYHREDQRSLSRFKGTIWRAVASSGAVIAFIVSGVEFLISLK